MLGVKTQGELECLVFHVGRWDQGSEVKVRSNGVGGQKLGGHVGLKGSVASKKERIAGGWKLEFKVGRGGGRTRDQNPVHVYQGSEVRDQEE